MHAMFSLNKGQPSNNIRTELFDSRGVPISGGMLYMYCNAGVKFSKILKSVKVLT